MRIPPDRIEADLRGAARAFDDVVVSPDAWQQNRERLLHDTTARRRQRLLAMAAAAVTVVLVAGLALFTDRAPSSDVPAADGAEPFASKNRLGPVIELQTADRGSTRHEVTLSDMTGDGPLLCERFVTESSASGGCSPRADDADDAEIAFDWLSGTTVDDSLRRLAGGVDSRVAQVDAWLTDGTRMVLRRHPGAWEGIHLFGLAVRDDEAVPQRLVAYAFDRSVLQAVDLSSRFGDEWLQLRSACSGDRVADHIPNGDVFPNAYVELGTSDARVVVRLDEQGEGVEGCVETLTNAPLAGWWTYGPTLVAIVGPETQYHRVEGLPSGMRADLHEVAGSPWRVLVATVPDWSRLGDTELVLYDRGEHVLQRKRVADLQNPRRPE